MPTEHVCHAKPSQAFNLKQVIHLQLKSNVLLHAAYYEKYLGLNYTGFSYIIISTYCMPKRHLFYVVKLNK